VTPPENSSGKTVRLALVELLPQVREFVLRAIARSRIVIVHQRDRSVSRKELAKLLVEKRPQVAIVPPELSGVASECHELFQSHSELKVLTIAISSKSADMYELCFLGKNIGLAGIAAAIHHVAEQRRTPATLGR
jgi:hypothetical protein